MKSAILFAGAGALMLVYSAYALCQGDAPERGREVFAMQKCALCHSIAGIGGKKMPLDHVGSKLKPEDMRKWIRTPKSMKSDSTMKSYPNLLEKDLNDLIAFLTTLK